MCPALPLPGVFAPLLTCPRYATSRGRGRMRTAAHPHAAAGALLPQSACPSPGTGKHPGPGHRWGHPKAPPETCTGKQRPSLPAFPRASTQRAPGSSAGAASLFPWFLPGPVQGTSDGCWVPVGWRPPRGGRPPCSLLSRASSPQPCAARARRALRGAAWKPCTGRGGSSEPPHAASAAPHRRLCAHPAGASGHRCHRTSH